MSKKKTFVCAQIDPEMREWLGFRARIERRTISAIIRAALALYRQSVK